MAETSRERRTMETMGLSLPSSSLLGEPSVVVHDGGAWFTD
ncbi:hypothetical protein [Lacipirellula sp.]